jgi:hypothetical protein
MPDALVPAALPGPSGAPLPASVSPAQAYARLREHCLGILEAWKGFDLEARFGFAEKRGEKLRRIEAALILISNLPEKAGPADYGPLATSFESGELSFLAKDLDSRGVALSAYADRMASKG